MENQKVLLFSEKKLFFLGPLFLVSTMAVGLFTLEKSPLIALFGIIFLSLIFFTLNPKKGISISFSLLMISILFNHFSLINHAHFALLGIETSLALGLFITYLSLQEMMEKKEVEELQRQKILDQMELEKEKKRKESESFEKRVINLQEQLEKKESELVKKEKEYVLAQELLEVVKKSDREIEEWKQKFLQEDQKKDEKIFTLEKRVQELSLPQKSESEKNLKSLYEQLRVEFEKKKEELHSVRKELFHMQEKIFTQEKEEEVGNKNISEMEEIFNKNLLELEEIATRSKQEISSLESLVSCFLNEKKPVRKRKSAKTATLE